MNRRRVLLTVGLVGSHWIALSAGGWLGVRAARDANKVAALSTLSSSETLAEAQLARGPSATTRSALIRRLALLDVLGPTSELPEETLDLERLFVVLRLWKVEVALGEPEQGNDYLEQAHRLCETAKWKDCSNAALERDLEARVTRRPQK